MKFATIITLVFAAMALAGPVKRYVVTEWEVVTVTVVETVTATRSRSATMVTTSAFSLSSTTMVPHISSTIPVTSLTSSTSSSSSISTTSTSSVQVPSPVGLSDYAAAVLEQHNLHRRNHSVVDLTWNQDLVDIAKEIADTCVYAHSNAFGDGEYGQNIGAGLPESGVPKMITDLMYNNEMIQYPGYDTEPSMSNFEAWGHFSQIVWKDTTQVGCYTATCQSLAGVGSNVQPYFTVCNYRPQGNYVGSFSKNVFRPLGHPSVVL